MELTLRDYKLDDLDIFSGKSYRLDNGIEIQQLSCSDWFFKYIPFLERCINHYHVVMRSVDFFSQETPEGFKDFKNKLAFTMLNINFIRDCIRFFISVKILRGSLGKNMKELPIDTVVKIFCYLYLLNTDGLKKKLLCLMEQVGIKKNTPSVTSSSSVNVTGGTRIVERITAKSL